MDSTIFEISLSDIRLQGSNVRSDLDSQNSQENIKELAENIRINGLLQPIVLRGTNGNAPYDVIVGQRRFLAHQLLGLPTIKATFSGEIDDTQALLISLSENMCRQEMNYVDVSNAITRLYNIYEKDELKVKEHTGFSIRMIRDYVKIEDQASGKIKSLLSESKISLADAKRAIAASQGNHDKADALIDELVTLSKYEKKRLVDSGIKNPDADAVELLNEAKQPKFEETIILNLPLRVHKALVLAAGNLSVDVEDLTISAITNWLKTNDYLIE